MLSFVLTCATAACPVIAQSQYTVIPITTPAMAPAGLLKYAPLAMNDYGQVFYYRDNAIGNFWDVWEGDGTQSTPVLVYQSPATVSSATNLLACPLCAYNTDGFLGANNSGTVTFAGAVYPGTGGAGPVGVYELGCATAAPCTAWSATPQPLVTGSSDASYPTAPSGLNPAGTVAFLQNLGAGVFPSSTSLTQSTQVPNYSLLDNPYSTYDFFAPPAINRRGEVLAAYNMQQPGGYTSPFLNFYGLNQSVECGQVQFAQVCAKLSTDLGGVGTYINIDTYGGTPGTASAPTLNDLENAAVIVAPGLSTTAGGSVTQWTLNLVSWGTVGTAGVYNLVQAGAANSDPYGGLLCGTPAINNYNQVLFTSGSSSSGGACNAALWVADAGEVLSGTAPPRQILRAAFRDASTSSSPCSTSPTDLSCFTDANGTSWTITSVVGASQQSWNSVGSIAAEVIAVPTAAFGTGTGTPTYFIVRADPMPGVSPGNPILPPCGTAGVTCVKTSVVLEYWCTYGDAAGRGWTQIAQTWNGTTWKSNVSATLVDPVCYPVYIDPPLATGYTYTVNANSPPFAGVNIPVALAHGQSTFNVSYGGFTGTVQAGTPFSFLARAPAGVSSFTLSGINASANLDATSPTAFTAGLIFLPPSAATTGPLAIAIEPIGSAAPAPDSTPPVITPVIAGTAGTDGWYRSNVSVSWQVTDAESSVTSTTGCGTNSVTSDTNGKVFNCSATSAGGTSQRSITIKRDTVLPLVGVLFPLEGVVLNRNSKFPALYACLDTLSGTSQCKGTVAAGSYIDTSTAGTKTFTVTGLDRAGNTRTSNVHYQVR